MNIPLNDNLDPDDWDQFAEYLAEFTSEEVNELARSIKQDVWQPVGDELKEVFETESVPMDGTDLNEVVNIYRETIRPYRNGNTHPRFFGWVQGTGNMPSLLADIAVSALNSNCGGRDHGAIYVERMVIDWCKSIFDFPDTTGGLLTSGTSNSTLLALQVGMFKKLGIDHKNKGFFNVCTPLRCYASVEGHSSIIKAIQTCGIGSDNLIVIPTDDDNRIFPEILKQRIEEDIAAGYIPFMVIANAGTVNTGAFDDFEAVRDICDEFDCWMHIDGAFGAWMKIADQPYQQLTQNMSMADSIAFDFHKLMYVQYDCGALLIRDGAFQQQVFSIRPNYLATHGKALAGGDPWFCDYGLELSRSFRALKVWFTFKTYGIEKLGKAVTENCRLAAYLGKLIKKSEHFMLSNPPVSNILTFKLSHHSSIDFNNQTCEEIVTRLQLDGEAVFSLTRSGEYLVIRASITNHRTRQSDIDFVMQRLNQLASEYIDEV